MITETRYALEARLSADALLAGILDLDPNVPDTPRPAILYAHLGSAPPPITCLTFRLTTLTPDKRFRPALPAVAVGGPDATSPIFDFRVDFVSWTLKRSGAVGEAIFERLMALLDNQAWIVNDAGGAQIARVFKGGCLTASLADYDDKLNSQFSLSSFQLRVIRTT